MSVTASVPDSFLTLGFAAAVDTKQIKLNVSRHPLAAKVPFLISSARKRKFPSNDKWSTEEIKKHHRRISLSDFAQNSRTSISGLRSTWCHLCGNKFGQIPIKAVREHLDSQGHHIATYAQPYRFNIAYGNHEEAVRWASATQLDASYKGSTVTATEPTPLGFEKSLIRTGTTISVLSYTVPFSMSDDNKYGEIKLDVNFQVPTTGTLVWTVANFQTETVSQMADHMNLDVRQQTTATVSLRLPKPQVPGLQQHFCHLLLIGSKDITWQRGLLLHSKWMSDIAARVETRMLGHVQDNVDDLPNDPRWNCDAEPEQIGPPKSKVEGPIRMIRSSGTPLRSQWHIWKQWVTKLNQYAPIAAGQIEWPKKRAIVVEEKPPSTFECSSYRLFEGAPLKMSNLVKRMLAENFGQSAHSDLNLHMAALTWFDWEFIKPRPPSPTDDEHELAPDPAPYVELYADVWTLEYEQLELYNPRVRVAVPGCRLKHFGEVTNVAESETSSKKCRITVRCAPVMKRVLNEYGRNQNLGQVRIMPEAGFPSQFTRRILEDILVTMREGTSTCNEQSDPIRDDDTWKQLSQLSLEEDVQETNAWRTPPETPSDGETSVNDDLQIVEEITDEPNVGKLAKKPLSELEQWKQDITSAFIDVFEPMMVRNPTPGKLISRELPPVTADTEIQKVVFDIRRHLDSRQNDVLSGLVSSERYQLIHGPPGTGKSWTIAALALSIALERPETKILITTETNAAAEAICVHLAAIITNSNIPFGMRFKLFLIYRAKKQGVLPSLAPYANAEDTTLKEILAASIIVSTVDLAILHFVNNSAFFENGESHFHMVIVDEAANLALSKASPIVTLAKRGKLVAVGDKKQLQAFMTDPVSLYHGGSESFMELMEQFLSALNRGKATRLRNNYRSTYDIIATSNRLIYDNELVAKMEQVRHQQLCADIVDHGLSNLFPGKRPDGSSFGVAVHTVHSQEEPYGSSFFNVAQADAVVQTAIVMTKAGISKSRIAIDGTYAAQVTLINLLLKEVDLYPAIKAKTANKLQGGEADYVLTSTVKASWLFDPLGIQGAMGFLADPRRPNVMFTRARLGNILFTHPLRFLQHPYIADILRRTAIAGGFVNTAWADRCHVYFELSEKPRQKELEQTHDAVSLMANYDAMWLAPTHC